MELCNVIEYIATVIMINIDSGGWSC